MLCYFAQAARLKPLFLCLRGTMQAQPIGACSHP